MCLRASGLVSLGLFGGWGLGFFELLAFGWLVALNPKPYTAEQHLASFSFQMEGGLGPFGAWQLQ